MTRKAIKAGMGVYQIKNTINGRLYVGSSTNMHDRWIAHRELMRGHRHNSLIQSDYDLYGMSAFEFDVLELVTDVNDLERYEQYYLDLHNPYYNVYRTASSGYTHSSEALSKISESHKGCKHSDETRQKISLNHADFRGNRSSSFGTPLKDSTRQKMSKALKGKMAGEKHPLYGKHHSVETKLKMSESHKGKVCGEKHPGAILTEEQVRSIKVAFLQGAINKNLALIYDVPVNVISKIRTGRTWKSVNI